MKLKLSKRDKKVERTINGRTPVVTVRYEAVMRILLDELALAGKLESRPLGCIVKMDSENGDFEIYDLSDAEMASLDLPFEIVYNVEDGDK